MQNTWYRLEDIREADYDPWAEFEQPNTSHPAFFLRAFPVLRETPAGVWLAVVGGPREIDGRSAKFVLRAANKRWACPTVDEAVVSWRARKAKQLAIYRKRVQQIEQAVCRLNTIAQVGLPALETNEYGWSFKRFR